MSQQTRIATVLPYYDRWLKRFPDWSSLARASQATVLRHWEGLGYYRRARFLHDLAKAVLRRPDRQLPSDPLELQKLPGIGDYTAGAIASIAFGISAPAFDGNVARVLGRLLARHGRAPSLKELKEFAGSLVPQRNPGRHNQALMELGALVCLPKNPLCRQCPLRSVCPSQKKLPPPQKPRPQPTRIEERILVVRRGNFVWLTRQHPQNRWRGLLLLPTTQKIDPKSKARARITYPFTRYLIAASVHILSRPPAGFIGRWFGPPALRKATLPAPHRRALALVKKKPY
jgi:A/G-specific adenine glycosylase